VTFQSKGFLRTAYSIVYSTSAYLAGVFTIVWYLTTAPGAQNARQFVVNVQVEGIYIVLDQVQPGLNYGIERPTTLFSGELSTTGEYAIVVLVTLMLYYFYSLYLGARLNHDAGRFGGIVAVLVVAALPIAYIVGSAIAATTQGILG